MNCSWSCALVLFVAFGWRGAIVQLSVHQLCSWCCLMEDRVSDFFVGRQGFSPLFSIPLIPFRQIVKENKEKQLIAWYNDWIHHFHAKIKWDSTAIPFASS